MNVLMFNSKPVRYGARSRLARYATMQAKIANGRGDASYAFNNTGKLLATHKGGKYTGRWTGWEIAEVSEIQNHEA